MKPKHIKEKIKDQAAEALSRLPHNWRRPQSNRRRIPVMSVNSSPNDEGKGCIKRNDVFEDFNDTGTPASSPGIHAMCPIRTPGGCYYTYSSETSGRTGLA